MAVIFPEALPFPLIGPFDGPRNRSRHMPITREMLEELLPSVLPLSDWVRLFKSLLHPYGGHLQFKKDQNWIDGPTIYVLSHVRRNCDNKRCLKGRRLGVSIFIFK